MTNGSFLRGLGIGIAGSVIAGLVVRDTVLMAIAMVVPGLVVGVVDAKRQALVGLFVGQLAALPVLIAVDFGTTIGNFINGGSIDELIGLWLLAALIWLAYTGCGAVGFFVGSRVGVARRPRPETSAPD